MRKVIVLVVVAAATALAVAGGVSAATGHHVQNGKAGAGISDGR